MTAATSPGHRRRERLTQARLYLCTADRPDLVRFVRDVCSSGVDVVQLRDKHLEARQLLERAALARDAAHEHGALFVLNDRPDLALACGADGVHVGQDDAPVALCRSVLGPDALIGLSTHAPVELDGAMDEPVDYVSVGPVQPTPTKPGRPGTGLDYVTHATRMLAGRLPFFVTGGIDPSTLPDVASAGAGRFVVVRALTEAAHPVAATRLLRAMIDALDDPPSARHMST